MNSKKHKILYVITKSNFGGAQRYVHELAEQFQNEANVVVACGGHGELVNELQRIGIRVITISALQRDVRIFKELRVLSELFHIIHTERPDILHLNSSKAIGLGALIGRLTRIPMIVATIHGWPFLERRNILWKVLVWFFSWCSALLAHKIILVSEYDARHAHMPFVAHKYTTIHTSVAEIDFLDRDTARTELFATDELASLRSSHATHPWIVTNAELTANKNLRRSIDAIIAYNAEHSPTLFYTIIGDGEQYRELATYIEMRQAQEYITLLGYIPNARQYLSAFDVFLLPSKKEGLPYALLEAGMAGLPIIASNVGGIPEIIQNDVRGILVRSTHTEDIVRALTTIVEDNERRSRYGSALRTYVQNTFSSEQMFAATRAVYWD